MSFTISDEQNLLDIPVMLEYWLYVISELESKYHLPIIQAIEDIQLEDFTLEKICENLINYDEFWTNVWIYLEK